MGRAPSLAALAGLLAVAPDLGRLPGAARRRRHGLRSAEPSRVHAFDINARLGAVKEQAKRPRGEAEPRVLNRGRYLTLIDDNGWEYVTRPNVTGIVVIVAITAEGKLLLVEQWRPAVKNRVIELPAGMVGDVDAHEPLVTAASRELTEETGFAAREMVPIGAGPIAVGVSDEVVSFFQALDPIRVGAGGGDATEDITVHEVPLSELPRYLAARAAEGLAVDTKIYAGLFLAGVQPIKKVAP
jgi:ADP-ribose pyrophosphatase